MPLADTVIHALTSGLVYDLSPILLASGLGGLLGPGFGLATANVLLALAPPERCAAYIALTGVSVYAISLIGPIAGALMPDSVGIRAAVLLAARLRLSGTLPFLLRPVKA